MLNDPALSTGFEQRWNQSPIWQLVSGVDDGTAGIPDGTDTFTINRNTGGFPQGNTDLSNEGMPGGHSIAGITGTGAPGRDIILKLADATIGNLTILPSPDPFEILAERDRSITIDGVISGAGDFLLARLGGFNADGVNEDELITITGDEPNTITGNFTLFNSSNSEPSYWVADKTGAFGQTPELTLEVRSGGTGIASLRFTANTVEGEGAIDDDATTFFIGNNGVLSIDAGVNEGVGEGKLFIDLAGTGTYTEVPVGTYDNTEDWIIGDGTFTVGASFAPLAVTSIVYEDDPTSVTLTWNSKPGQDYLVAYSTDMLDWTSKLTPVVPGSSDESTTQAFDLSSVTELDNETKVFFRVEETSE